MTMREGEAGHGRGYWLTPEEMRRIPAVEAGGGPDGAPPTVSVIMITRNHAAFIREAVTSVLRQEQCPPYEVLIGEDASSDGTADLCRRLAAEYPGRIRLITSDGNVGMHRNFARLWCRARGPYIAICEGDDYWTDTLKLAKQVSCLEKHPEVSMCAASTRIIRRSAEGAWQSCGEFVPPVRKERYGLEDLIPHYSFHTSSVVVRKAMISFPRWLWEVYCVDRPLYLLCAERGPVAYRPEFMSVYRMQEGGVWAPLSLLEKARNGARLFEMIDRHFHGRHHRLIRRSLAAIIWSYFGEALLAGDRVTARRILALLSRYVVPDLPASPILMAKAALRCCRP